MSGNIGIAPFLSDVFLALLSAVPTRSMATLFELLVGLLQVKTAHLSSVIFFLGGDCHWTTYYWFIRKANWSWLLLLQAWIKGSLHVSDESLILLAIDDFIVQRSTKQAPGVIRHYDHAHKKNRSTYIQGQGWVNLSRIIQKKGIIGAIPLVNRLSRVVGNPTKLKTAKVLCWLVFPLFEGRLLRLLMDAWYMKGPLILPLLSQFPNLEIIGQVRKDTALFYPPKPEEQPPKQGRRRKYGQKVNFDDLAEHQLETVLYGKKQIIRYRTCECLARFLKGHRVRAVWLLLQDAKKWKLLLSTNPQLDALEILFAYEKRWKVEPSYNDFKNRFGLLQAWQHTRQSLARWVTLLTIAYGINKLLAILKPDGIEKITPEIPWRKNKPLTAGWVQLGIVRLFVTLRLDHKSRTNFSRNRDQIVKELFNKCYHQLK